MQNTIIDKLRPSWPGVLELPPTNQLDGKAQVDERRDTVIAGQDVEEPESRTNFENSQEEAVRASLFGKDVQESDDDLYSEPPRVQNNRPNAEAQNQGSDPNEPADTPIEGQDDDKPDAVTNFENNLEEAIRQSLRRQDSQKPDVNTLSEPSRSARAAEVPLVDERIGDAETTAGPSTPVREEHVPLRDFNAEEVRKILGVGCEKDAPIFLDIEKNTLGQWGRRRSSKRIRARARILADGHTKFFELLRQELYLLEASASETANERSRPVPTIVITDEESGSADQSRQEGEASTSGTAAKGKQPQQKPVTPMVTKTTPAGVTTYHPVCLHCKKIGHKQENCFRLYPEQRTNRIAALPAEEKQKQLERQKREYNLISSGGYNPSRPNPTNVPANMATKSVGQRPDGPKFSGLVTPSGPPRPNPAYFPANMATQSVAQRPVDLRVSRLVPLRRPPRPTPANVPANKATKSVGQRQEEPRVSAPSGLARPYPANFPANSAAKSVGQRPEQPKVSALKAPSGPSRSNPANVPTNRATKSVGQRREESRVPAREAPSKRSRPVQKSISTNDEKESVDQPGEKKNVSARKTASDPPRSPPRLILTDDESEDESYQEGPSKEGKKAAALWKDSVPSRPVPAFTIADRYTGPVEQPRMEADISALETAGEHPRTPPASNVVGGYTEAEVSALLTAEDPLNPTPVYSLADGYTEAEVSVLWTADQPSRPVPAQSFTDGYTEVEVSALLDC